jgi:hypothetical protein
MISPHNPANWESEDRPLNCKGPLLAGFSATVKGQLSHRQNAWLATQC